MHSTANPDSTAWGNAHNSHARWRESLVFVHYFVDDEEVYQSAPPGYKAWGAGNVNPYSPVQIELCEFSDHARALKAYHKMIDLIKELAPQYGCPLTIDDSNRNAGVKSHDWCRINYGGTDHTDPWRYLKSIGITKAQVAADLAGETKDGDDEMSFSVKVPVDRVGGALITKTDGAKIYTDASLTKASGKKVNRGSQWVVVAIKDGALSLGGSQWIDGRDAVVKLNPIASNPHAVGVAVVTSKDLWTQAKPGKGQAGIKHLPQGSKWKVAKLTDGYLSAGTGQWIDVSKVKIEL